MSGGVRRRGRPGRAAAAAVACALALGALAPTAALAEAPAGNHDMSVNVFTTDPSSITRDEDGEFVSNVAVTVPTELPLALSGKDEVSIYGPTNAEFRNTGSAAVRLAKVEATIEDRAFTVVPASGLTASEHNLIHVDFAVSHFGASATDEPLAFTLADIESDQDAGKNGLEIAAPGWVIPPDYSKPDSITVNRQTSRVAHLNKDLTAGTRLASLKWTFAPASA